MQMCFGTNKNCPLERCSNFRESNTCLYTIGMRESVPSIEVLHFRGVHTEGFPCSKGRERGRGNY